MHGSSTTGTAYGQGTLSCRQGPVLSHTRAWCLGRGGPGRQGPTGLVIMGWMPEMGRAGGGRRGTSKTLLGWLLLSPTYPVGGGRSPQPQVAEGGGPRERRHAT